MKILVFPEGKNPYQELLYNQLKEKFAVKVEFPKQYFKMSKSLNLLILPFDLLMKRLQGFKIFHIHWTYGFTPPIQSIVFRTIYFFYFVLIFFWIKILGFKVVWTVHNILPHEKQFVNDFLARRFLARISDAKIVHCKNTIEEMKKNGLNTKNVSVISIGNYIDVYSNTSTRQESRKRLGIQDDKFVFLHFGNIRSYKGIDHLLEIFKKLNKSHPNTFLLIGGKCSFLKSKKLLNKYKNDRNIKIFDNYIPDRKVQYYFNASDVVVFPFKKVTTSSSVILALSFKKPIIAPRLGCLKDIPNRLGFFYEEKEINGLIRCMKKAIEERKHLGETGMVAYEYVEKLDWKEIAEKSYRIYKYL